MGPFLLAAPWCLVLVAAATSGMFRLSRDGVVGLVVAAPWLVLAFIVLVGAVSVLVDVGVIVFRVAASPSVKLEITSLISAAACAQRVNALGRAR